jgi:hypothetical protein
MPRGRHIITPTSARPYLDGVPGTTPRLGIASSSAQWWGGAVALGAVAFIGVATLRQSGDTVPPPWCLSCALRNEGLAADSILNVFLFVPLGVGLRAAGVRAALVVAAALAVSLLVEVMQAYVIPGRVANVVDLVTNTVGGGVGAIATPRWRNAVFPSERVALLLALVSMGGLVSIVATTTWALTPAFPRAPLVVRGVDQPGMPTASERVLSGVVNRRAVRSGDTVLTSGPHALPMRVEVELQAPRSRWQEEPALELVSDDQTLVWLGIDQNELELEFRRKGAAARFLSPSVRVPRPAPLAEGPEVQALDTIRLRAAADRWRMNLAAEARRARDDHELRLHALSGWSLIVRVPRSRWAAELLTAFWTAALFFPVAYWCAVAAERRSGFVISAVLVAAVAGVLAVGAGIGAPWPPASAMLAGMLSVIGAWALQWTIKGGGRMLRAPNSSSVATGSEIGGGGQ